MNKLIFADNESKAEKKATNKEKKTRMNSVVLNLNQREYTHVFTVRTQKDIEINIDVYVCLEIIYI